MTNRESINIHLLPNYLHNCFIDELHQHSAFQNKIQGQVMVINIKLYCKYSPLMKQQDFIKITVNTGKPIVY